MDDFEYFNSLLRYDPENGLLWWRKSKPGRQFYKPAGHAGKDGYVRIMIDYKMYLAHRIIWLLIYGEWPSSMLDHIDQNPRNNRLKNLRLSNHSKNGNNSPAKHTNNTGERGIEQTIQGTFSVRLRRQTVGTFPTFEQALRAKEEFLCNLQKNS